MITPQEKKNFQKQLQDTQYRVPAGQPYHIHNGIDAPYIPQSSVIGLVSSLASAGLNVASGSITYVGNISSNYTISTTFEPKIIIAMGQDGTSTDSIGMATVTTSGFTNQDNITTAPAQYVSGAILSFVAGSPGAYMKMVTGTSTGFTWNVEISNSATITVTWFALG